MAVVSCCSHAHIRTIHVLRAVNADALAGGWLVLAWFAGDGETTASRAIVPNRTRPIIRISIRSIRLHERARRINRRRTTHTYVPRIAIASEGFAASFAVLAWWAGHALAFRLRVVSVHELTGRTWRLHPSDTIITE